MSDPTDQFGPFPPDRPSGLRRRSVPAGSVFWRLDSQSVVEWTWNGFPSPRNRFDPVSGDFRVRYAATGAIGAARERYMATGGFIPSDHGRHRVVRLQASRTMKVLDLRHEANLDRLRVDDRISTGRERHVWDACHRLADAVRSWWPDLDGIAYRSRTTPESSSNLAFFSLHAFTVSERQLQDASELLVELVLGHGFTANFDFEP